ncbi:MAG: sulfatase-like hydrolase/transferase, partial [Planctomycetota bacterium]
AHTVEGFQRAFTMDKAGSYWDLSRGTREQLPLTIDGKEIADIQARFPGFYTTDAFADEAVRWLDEGKQQPKPFFLYMAFNAPHYPLHAPAEDIARFRGKYKAGWDVLREARFQKQLKLGLWPAGMRASPRDPKVKAWTSLTPQEQDREDLRMATYAAMVSRLDTAIGRVLKQIETMQATKDTVVMFCSDNGASSEDEANRVLGPEPGPPGSWWYTGPGWAWMSNTPFRKFKTQDHEGGISDPLIVSWPGQVKPGNDTQMAVITDLTATCLALAGRPNDKILGKSLLPGAGEGKRPLHETHCWAIFSAKAVREGDLKAVAVKGTWELHDMAQDRTELDDLAEKRPQDLARLIKTWEAWAKQVNVPGGGRE